MFLAMKTAERLSPAPTACPGDATAQFNLGAMYYYAQGVAQDYAAALSWFRKAADQGYAEAQNNLGVMYATDQGHARAQCNLGVFRAQGRGGRPPHGRGLFS